MQNFYIGRQPIYNMKLGCIGYELLFRDGDSNDAEVTPENADSATSTALLNVVLEIGLEKLVGGCHAFINLTESFLLDEDALPVLPGQITLEILEDIPVDDRLINATKRLKEEGFTIALDDYIYNPAHKPLVELADIIKIDIRALSKDEIQDHINVLKKFRVKMLAEKIENMDEFDFCVGLGFDYFQGYFLGKPRVIKSEGMPTNKMAILNLLSVLHNPKSEIDELEQAISVDVTVSYKILKLINSAFYNFNHKIESVKEVIVILGRKKLMSWASVMAMASMDDRPLEMIKMAMVRARMCELLAQKSNIEPSDSYFTAGLFSALDALMEKELSFVLEPLPLSDELVQALLEREGSLGEALSCILAYEVSDFDSAHFKYLQPKDLVDANIEAIAWANDVVRVL